jgi:hypothetical protein
VIRTYCICLNVWLTSSKMVTPDDGTVRFWNTCRVGHNKSGNKQCICWFNYLINLTVKHTDMPQLRLNSISSSNKVPYRVLWKCNTLSLHFHFSYSIVLIHQSRETPLLLGDSEHLSLHFILVTRPQNKLCLITYSVSLSCHRIWISVLLAVKEMTIT